MPTMHCALCNRPVEGRRHIGVGTVVLAVFTGGLSLLAIPFYARRCPICRSSAVAMMPHGAPASARLLELEQRLRRTEAELDSAQGQLEQVTTERDFYRQLVGDRPASERGA